MAAQARRPRVELVVLLASAGGLDALSIVLHDLPREFPAAVVVQQHLGGHSSVLPTILGRSTNHRVAWALDGQFVEPGQVIVCPPEMHMELGPDGSCRLHKVSERGDRPFDALLKSVAGSYGPRAVAVVLTGSGRDGAMGTAAMGRAGAIVIAQSPDTADYPSMPLAAVEAGADMVLPIYEIGRTLGEIVAGGPPGRPEPRARSEEQAARVASGTGTAPTAAGPMERGHVAAEQRDGRTRLSPNPTPNSPAGRAETARLRAAELRRRRQDLASGIGASAETVAIARRRAQEGLRRAQLAHQAASRAAAEWGR
ncbi:chemotaxis protein CheB [Mycobacterium sp. 663a-19]|uniref:chemotaxis protein CheB n=1 Tax=Mycobacterium sp. 663a-19 TaxID=2986148 RepID=UPI002D1E8BFD|nr:chemotaxis protein CheB [Mycobacterium sp. 663a-19]MEB3982120.1 chemotaxis protein CheB [Mycobacterium sp. 663a-19]